MGVASGPSNRVMVFIVQCGGCVCWSFSWCWVYRELGLGVRVLERVSDSGVLPSGIHRSGVRARFRV